MRSSNEMYERGVTDAEQDDLNLFYYQHYYHYRKGYDTARRRLRSTSATGWLSPGHVLPVVLTVVLVGVLFSTGVIGWPASSNSTADGAASIEAPTRTPRPTRTPTPAEPTATPAPSATPEPVLQVGGQAQVGNLSGALLRARVNPGIGQPVQASFEEGMQVTILEGPVEADGYVWWLIENENGTGWSAERNPEPDGAIWLQPLP